MNSNLYCVIMAGGIGSRFWPLSRTSRPKQFIDIMGTGRTLIQQTYDRFLPFIPKENFIVVTGMQYKDLVLEQLPELNSGQILAEPMRRNTGPCIAYASYKLKSINPNATVIVTPADHLITNDRLFAETIISGCTFAEDGKALVTIGIKPTHPETGYGYIQVDKLEKDLCDSVLCKVKTFTEKPNLEMAKIFVESGEFFWNSGMFIWKLDAIIGALETHLPDIATLFKAGDKIYGTNDEENFIQNTYADCNSISIDYGVMEKANNVYVLLASFGWSDLGTWESLYRQSEKDNDSNVIGYSNNTMLFDVKHSMIKSDGKRLVVVKGLENFLIVDSDDVLMITPLDDEGNLKNLINDVLITKGETHG